MKQLSFLEPAEQKVKNAEYTQWQLFVDGASRNNPGLAGAGIHIIKDSIVFFERGYFLGTKTNNQAEYIALLVGLFHCSKLIKKNDRLHIASDSQLLIKQLNKEYQVRQPEIRQLYEVALRLLEGINYSLSHIPRELNERADFLANQGIDKKKALPADFIRYVHVYGITF